MNKLYYIAETDFTKDSPCANRVMHNAMTINAINKFDVVLIGYSDTPALIKNGFQIKNVKKGKRIIPKVLYFLFRGIFIVNLLRKEKYKPDIIINYTISNRFLLPLLIYAHRNGIKIITDVVEWFNYSHLPMGKYGLEAIDVHISMTRIIPLTDGVIAISSYLQDYYKKKGLRTIRIPVTINAFETNLKTVNDLQLDPGHLNLIYAGKPLNYKKDLLVGKGSKDLIYNIIDGVRKINNEGLAVRLHIFGPEKSDLETEDFCLGEEYIICYGFVPHDKIASYLDKADFSVLLRPQERYAQAGFPTKFVESLNAGLPVIANLTSDLSKYLIDGVNGYVVAGFSPEEFAGTLRRIEGFNKSQYEVMRKNAKETAIQYFDYRIFVQDLGEFLQNIMDR